MTATERGVVDREHSVLAEVGIHWLSFQYSESGLATCSARMQRESGARPRSPRLDTREHDQAPPP